MTLHRPTSLEDLRSALKLQLEQQLPAARMSQEHWEQVGLGSNDEVLVDFYAVQVGSLPSLPFNKPVWVSFNLDGWAISLGEDGEIDLVFDESLPRLMRSARQRLQALHKQAARRASWLLVADGEE